MAESGNSMRFFICGSTVTTTYCTGNTIAYFTTAMSDCSDDGGNASH
jgi:hypothetical protein